jgi:sulfate adenylyltransferase subunit 1 (EFTu-like GTPase family)
MSEGLPENPPPPERRYGVSDRRHEAKGSGVLEFALACLLVALVVAGNSLTFALTNRVDISDLEEVQNDLLETQQAQQEGRRVGIAGICSVEKALIEEGAVVILQGRGNNKRSRNAALSYKINVVMRARREARALGVGDLPELGADGTIDCRAFAKRTKADKSARAKATPTP